MPTRVWSVLLWIALYTCLKRTEANTVSFGDRLKPLKVAIQKTRPPQTGLSCNISTNKAIKTSDLNVIQKRSDITPENKPETEVLRIPMRKSLDRTQQTASPIYSGFPKENVNKKGTTFFFTQVEPHRFEYRAMFQHHRNDFHHHEIFQPFVHNFDSFSKDFPPLPKFPAVPQFHQIFTDFKDPFPNFPEFTFPTLSPILKKVWEPHKESEPPKSQEPDFERPLVNDYDSILEHNNYPKIFKFNEERINIEDFDRDKKIRLYKLSSEGQNNLVEPENVKRDQLLILHGGIFTVQEPPLYNKHARRKVRKNYLFGTKIS